MVPVYGALRPSTAAACSLVLKMRNLALCLQRRPFSLPLLSAPPFYCVYLFTSAM